MNTVDKTYLVLQEGEKVLLSRVVGQQEHIFKVRTARFRKRLTLISKDYLDTLWLTYLRLRMRKPVSMSPSYVRLNKESSIC